MVWGLIRICGALPGDVGPYQELWALAKTCGALPRVVEPESFSRSSHQTGQLQQELLLESSAGLHGLRSHFGPSASD